MKSHTCAYQAPICPSLSQIDSRHSHHSTSPLNLILVLNLLLLHTRTHTHTLIFHLIILLHPITLLLVLVLAVLGLRSTLLPTRFLTRRALLLPSLLSTPLLLRRVPRATLRQFPAQFLVRVALLDAQSGDAVADGAGGGARERRRQRLVLVCLDVAALREEEQPRVVGAFPGEFLRYVLAPDPSPLFQKERNAMLTPPVPPDSPLAAVFLGGIVSDVDVVNIVVSLCRRMQIQADGSLRTRIREWWRERGQKGGVDEVFMCRWVLRGEVRVSADDEW
jgi:hypothetical protein